MSSQSSQNAGAGAGQRIGCQACDMVGRLTGAAVAEDVLHNRPCPDCGEIGYLHEFPVPGTWPSEYSGCPKDPGTKYDMDARFDEPYGDNVLDTRADEEDA